MGMIDYLKSSISKFKTDLLAKGLYDILKDSLKLGWPLFLGLIPAVREFFLTKFETNLFATLLFSGCLVLITVFFMHFSFQKRIRRVLDDNHTDELTGLKNHKALSEYLNLKLNEAKNGSESLSLIIIDIDDFKNFNTQYGFNVADQILKKLGELLGNDKRATDETFRYFNRGDEFLVVAHDTTLSQALQAAERKRKWIQKTHFSVDGKNHKLTVCCGVTEFKKIDDYTSITDRVIVALNEAKKISGKNNTQSIS